MANIKRAYFSGGTLPDQDTICEIDRGHFFGDREARVYSAGEVQVLADMAHLAESMGMLRRGL